MKKKFFVALLAVCVILSGCAANTDSNQDVTSESQSTGTSSIAADDENQTEESTSSEIQTETANQETGVAGVPFLTLSNGVKMPQLGLGTFGQDNDQVAYESCLSALESGYRHIDTAHGYFDERGIGQAVKDSGIPREDIWITSKLWPTEYGEGTTLAAIDAMLERLQLDYIDLVYLHHPYGDYIGAWHDLEKAYEDGKIRAIGISNFDLNLDSFDELMENATIKPHVWQMELNPFAQRDAMLEFADRNNITIEGWYPLGHGNQDLLNDSTILEIAQGHNKTAAQVILRWHIQKGVSVIPGSRNPDHIKENISIFDFELTDEEMEQIATLNRNQRSMTNDTEDTEESNRRDVSFLGQMVNGFAERIKEYDQQEFVPQ